MTAKELLAQRVSALTEEEAAETLQFLDRREKPPVIDYDTVPPEDEEISPEEEAAIQEGLDDLARGDVESWEQVKAELGL